MKRHLIFFLAFLACGSADAVEYRIKWSVKTKGLDHPHDMYGQATTVFFGSTKRIQMERTMSGGVAGDFLYSMEDSCKTCVFYSLEAIVPACPECKPCVKNEFPYSYHFPMTESEIKDFRKRLDEAEGKKQ